MLKRTVTYTNYNNQEVTEDFYFNLTKAELVEMQYEIGGGLEERLKKIIDAKDQPEIVKQFKEILLRAYGEKSPDGKYFNKSKEISERFSRTEAYSIIFMELATDAQKAADFINAITPKVKEAK